PQVPDGSGRHGAAKRFPGDPQRAADRISAGAVAERRGLYLGPAGNDRKHRPNRARGRRALLCRSVPANDDASRTSGGALGVALRRDHFVLPSLSYCERYAQRAFASFSFLMPANTILVPGIFPLGSLMYSRKVSLFQVMPEFLLASE